jgi:hypothetical protein
MENCQKLSEFSDGRNQWGNNKVDRDISLNIIASSDLLLTAQPFVALGKPINHFGISGGRNID